MEHFDVLIVGAGISGIGAGYHLQDKCPERSYVILEGRGDLGGTWDLFRYPGVRSDSDMHTLGYAFRPWTEAKSIADGPSIMKYLRETAREYGIDQKIRFRHYVKSASWSSRDARWTVEVERGEARERVHFSCNFLFMCSGYYDYAEGYTPEFPGTQRFAGPIIHPQKWTDDIDYQGKRVLVIGSGATAVTLVPAMAEQASHVTMLQRSPTYMVSMRDEDRFANWLRRHLPERLAYQLTRWKNIILTLLFYRISRRRPQRVRKWLLRGVREELGPDYDIETHFTPSYNPWDQRVCLVPNGDLFQAIRTGRASVVTDHIETFTERGVELTSGRELEADLIVTATGLNLKFLSDLKITVDGAAVEPSQKVTYKSLMMCDVPNLAWSMGYTNASWTLKCDLTCEYVCRLLNHMHKHGYERCTPRIDDPDVEPEPIISLTSGYVQRAIHRFPKQGSKMPWRLHQNYARDLVTLGLGRVDDGVMEFSGPVEVAGQLEAGEGVLEAPALPKT